MKCLRIQELSWAAAVMGACLTAVAYGAPQTAVATPTGPLQLSNANWLVLPPVGRGGRGPVHMDALEAQIAAGTWQPPKPGDRVTLPDGSARAWESIPVPAGQPVRSDALRGGYACYTVESPVQRTAILEASGHTMVYANGAPRPGDPYATRYVHIPVLLERGINTFLFSCGRGDVQAKLTAPRAEVSLDGADTTLPDLLVFGSDTLARGTQGVRGAGYFGLDWRLESGEFACAP